MISTRSSKIAVLALVAMTVLVALSATLSQDASASDEYAQPDDISVSPSVSSLKLNAGDSKTIYLDIKNELVQTSADAMTLIVYVYFDNTDDISVEFPDGNRVVVDGGEVGYCRATIVVDKYATSTTHSLSFDITINDPERGSPIRATASDLVNITVYSQLSAGSSYNKILGYWSNPLPSPFNQPIWTTIISFMVWVALAIVVSYFILPPLIGWSHKAKQKVVSEWDELDLSDVMDKGGEKK